MEFDQLSSLPSLPHSYTPTKGGKNNWVETSCNLKCIDYIKSEVIILQQKEYFTPTAK